MDEAQNEALPLRRRQFTLRDLLVDTLLLALCAVALRCVPTEAPVVAVFLFGAFSMVIVLGRVCDLRHCARIGAIVGAFLGPALFVPATFAARPPDYNRIFQQLVFGLPLFVVGGAAATSLFFVLVYWIQHLGQRR
jgi:hypothetical protein